MLYQYLRLIFEEDIEESSERSEQQLALAKAVDTMAKSLEATSWSVGIKEKYRENEKGNTKATESSSENLELTKSKSLLVGREGELCGERSNAEDDQVKYQRKISVLYQLLSACVADTPQDSRKGSRNRKGYDARHRVALRLLATWLDVKWLQMVRIA